MAINRGKRISELTALESASLQTTLVGVDNGTTYKVTLDVLEDAIISMVSRSTDLRLDSLELFTSSYDSVTIPNGTISSSAQISDFGFISSSHTDITSLNSFTSSQNTLNSAFTTGISARLQTSSFNDFSASIDGRVDGLESWSSSLTDTFATDLEVSIVSSSVAATLGIISQNTGLVTTSSFNQYTSSQSTLNNTFATTGSNQFSGSQSITGSLTVSSTFVNDSNVYLSGSDLIVDDGNLHISGNIDVSGSLVVSSTIVNNATLALTGSDLIIDSGSLVITGSISLNGTTYTSLTGSGELPSDIISSSQQILDLGFVTGSYTTINEFNSLTQSFNSISQSFTVISGSVGTIDFTTLATTGSNTFNGDETISGSLFVSGTTELGGNIVPKTARGATLGTTERPFREIYVQSGSINISSDIIGDPNTTLSNIGGNILVSAGGMRLIGDASFIAATGSFGYISGSMTQVGDYTQTGDYVMVGDKTITGSLNISGDITSSATIQANKFVFEDGIVQTNSLGQKIYATDTGTLYFYSGENGITFFNEDITETIATLTNDGTFTTSNGIVGDIQSTNGVISGSSQLTSSFDERYTLSGSVQPLPSNLVSSSAQITAFGFISSSTTIDTGSFNSIGFNTSAGVSVGVGELAWNNADGTLDLGMKGGNVVQQIGQEIFYEVRNETGIQIPNGTAVYANGVTAGSGRITAAPYVADGNIRENRFLGIATENISTGVNGFVTHFGYVRDLDTRGTTASSITVGDETWAVGDILYVHPTVAGKLTNVKPQHEISVAIIIVRHQSAGVIFVRPTSSGHLGDIHDISINTGSLSNGQVLSYNSTSGVWENTNTISGSSQLTSSFDSRYVLSGSIGAVPDGTISGSSQLTSSFDTRYLNAGGDGVWSGSAQVTGNLAVTSVSASVFVGGYLVPEAKFTVLSSKPMTFWPNTSYESVRLTTGGGVLIGRNGDTNDYGLKLDVSGSTRFTGNINITGSVFASNGFTGSISATNGVISGSSQLTSSYDGRYTQTGSFNTYTSSINSWTSSFSSSLASSITSVSGAFSELTLNGSRINANGIINKSFIKYTRTTQQTSLSNGSVIVCNVLENSSGNVISPNTTTGQITLTAGKTYRLKGMVPGFTTSGINVRPQFCWYNETTAAYIGSSAQAYTPGDAAAYGVFGGAAEAVITPNVTTIVSFRLLNGASGLSAIGGNGDFSTTGSYPWIDIEELNASFALNTISGGINYRQVLGNQRSNISSAGTSIVSGSITTTGKPVEITVSGDANPTSGTGLWCSLQIYRDDTAIGNAIQVEAANNNENQAYCLSVIDTPAAGTYTYSLRVPTITGTFQFGEAGGPVLIIKELGSLTIITDTNNTFTGTNTFNDVVTIGPSNGDEGGELHFALAQTNNSLTGSVNIDVWRNRLRLWEGGGNARGVYVDLSKAPDGVGGELLYKASGFVDAGVDVTLGNLKARIPTTGNKSLQLSTVSGTYSVYGSSVYSYNGVGAVTLNNGTPLNVTTTPQYLASGYDFLVAGSTDVWNIMDTSAGIAWRITMIIGASYLNNFISIERL